MTDQLIEPKLAPRTIIEAYKDGGALRNDGVTLKPASRNPWYVLATVAGEQDEDGIDFRLHARNLRFWNGWMCSGLDEAGRALFAKYFKLPASALDPLSDDEKKIIQERFSQAFPDQQDMIPRRDQNAVMSEVYFPSSVSFCRLFFPGRVDFRDSHFHGATSFVRTYFTGIAFFQDVRFTRYASFHSAMFHTNSVFVRAQFDGDAHFNNSDFRASCHFDYSHFAEKFFFCDAGVFENATFLHTRFENIADFRGGRFSKGAQFMDCKFKSSTSFLGRHFQTEAPQFFQSEMYHQTIFSEDEKLWPSVTDDNAAWGKLAYTRLRQIAAADQNPDLEHFFLRQEMRCKEHLADSFDKAFFKSYRLIADYGISVARPLAGLAGVAAINWGPIGSYLKYGLGNKSPIAEGLFISIGNTLPFLGLVDKRHNSLLEQAPLWLNTVSALQSVAGLVLLFFLALGLRNRFRLK